MIPDSFFYMLEWLELKFHRFLITLISRDVGTGIFFAGFTVRVAKPHKINYHHRPPAIEITNQFFNEICYTFRIT